jgi:hypothetical protein
MPPVPLFCVPEAREKAAKQLSGAGRAGGDNARSDRVTPREFKTPQTLMQPKVRLGGL